MMASRDQNSIGKSIINDNLFNDDEVHPYDDIERTHRNSADSSSSERTLFVSYLDLRDAFESSIHDKPEIHTCDCAMKSALKNTINNDKILENQSEIIQNQNELQQEQSQPSQPSRLTQSPQQSQSQLQSQQSQPQLQPQQQSQLQSQPSQPSHQSSQPQPQPQPQQQQQQPQQSQSPPSNNEVYLLFIFVSVISYVIGYFGFTSVWLMIVLYQSVKWYINVTNDHKQRVRWEVVREMSMDKMRRDDGESVEWLNYLLQQIWRTFDPSLLIGLRDTFEDVMARSAPSFIVATDIESFEIGIIAPRIENIKILPRCENQDDDDVVIGEATFSFRAPSSNMSRNDAPPHILAWIKTGISAVIPIKVEIIGFKASIHFEIKLSGTSPFISTGRFGFLKTPIFETSIMPLIPMNITQFPVIKEFLRNTMETVLKQFTYPHHIDLDLEQMLMGDDLLHDTQAIGIMRVDIIEARNLTRADISGENDPYVISSLDPSPYTNTHSTTRVIENCAKPVWRETFFHKVPELDIVDEHIKFRLKVMDWDRFTADDHIGSVWFDIKDAIGNGEHERLIYDGWKKIKLSPDDTATHGELHFRLKYYPKLNKVEEKPEQTSGIFGLKIHQAINLQITTAPYIEETIMMSDNHYNASFPNPYAVVYINDSKVFRTRAKLNNVAPFWNASTEQFVKDWKNAIVRVVIKDQKDLEYDPVIGIVTLSMKELFENNKKKEATKWFPLRYGVGCGKVRLTFLLKPLSMILPPEEKGYDVGTLLIHSIIAKGLDSQYANRSVYLTLTIRNTEIVQETNVSNSFPPKWLEQNSSDSEKNHMEFAVFRRYRTSLIITVHCKGLLGIYYTVGMAEYWLSNVVDGCETEVEIPIFVDLPKCFPASDIAESSQDTNESNESKFDGIPRCESPIQDIQDLEDFEVTAGTAGTAGSTCDSNLEKASEKVIEKAQSTEASTDVIPPEEVGESSQNIQNDEKSEQKDVSELDDPKSNPDDEISIITQPNDSNNTNKEGNENKEPNKSSDQLSLKPTEISSEKSVLNKTETTSTSNPSEKLTTNVSEKSEKLEKATISEIPPQEPSATITSNASNERSLSNGEIKGFLRFNVHFKPGLSLAHEQDIQRSLTGVNASILSEHPLEDIEKQQKRLREQRQVTDIYSENYESETKQRRINKVHRRRTMRQLQWVKDLVKAKVVSMSGKREWEDEEIIEHEV